MLDLKKEVLASAAKRMGSTTLDKDNVVIFTLAAAAFGGAPFKEAIGIFRSHGEEDPVRAEMDLRHLLKDKLTLG